MTDPPPQFKLPDDFPDADLTAFILQVGVLDAQFRLVNNGQPSTSWREFASGAEGLRVRFRTLAESDEAFRLVVPRFAETQEDRYEEERSLFAFFTALVSTLESACYMFYALAAQLDPVAFKMVTNADMRDVTPRLVAQCFADQYGDEPLTASLDELVRHRLFNQSYEFRNLLSHRGRIPRHYDTKIVLGDSPTVLGGVNSTVTPTIRGVPMDLALTMDRRVWIAIWLQEALAQALVFAEDHI